MKILLDLEKSFNHYHWENEDKEELVEYILNMRDSLWKFYQDEVLENENIDDDTIHRLYDILDMFNDFTIIEEKGIEDKNNVCACSGADLRSEFYGN